MLIETIQNEVAARVLVSIHSANWQDLSIFYLLSSSCILKVQEGCQDIGLEVPAGYFEIWLELINSFKSGETSCSVIK